MVTVGVIGCGKIAKKRHIPEYLNNTNVIIAGYYDPTTEKAREQAAAHGGKVYETIEELLGDKSINAVSVCLANAAHADITVQALKAGKHVLCEKPMATKMKECIWMAETAEKQKQYLMIAHNQRLSRKHRMARKLIEERIIGEVLTFHTVFGHGGPEKRGIALDKPVWFFDKEQAVMGAMADLGIHKIDLIRYLLNEEIDEIVTRTATLDKRTPVGCPIDVEDNALCLIRMSGGALGTVAASWTYYGEDDNSTSLYGTEGIMKIPGPWEEQLLIIKKDGKKIWYDVKEKRMQNGMVNSGVVDEFVEAILQNRQPIISGKDVLASMQAIFPGSF